MTTLDPKAWFDQFPPLAEGAEWPVDGQWCPRHWAPCPVMDANGIGATVELMQIFLTEIKPSNITAAAAVNRYMQTVGHLCCTLGDDRMYELWGRWGPEACDGG